MEKNKEIEYKILVSKETFTQICQFYPKHHTYTQVNYYLTSPQLAAKRYALRVREKDGTYEMTLKIPQGFAKMEHNEMISKADFESIENGVMIDNDITRLLASQGFDLSLIKQEYSLKTIRHDIPLDYGMLSMDENFYNGHHDYEFEFEVNDEKKGALQFDELCALFHLTYTGNCESKIKRVLATL